MKRLVAFLLGAGLIVDLTDASTFDQIVLRDDETKCVAHVSSSSVDVELATCKGGNTDQDWEFSPGSSGGQWRPASKPTYCVKAPPASTPLPAALSLDLCSSSTGGSKIWDHNKYL